MRIRSCWDRADLAAIATIAPQFYELAEPVLPFAPPPQLDRAPEPAGPCRPGSSGDPGPSHPHPSLARPIWLPSCVGGPSRTTPNLLPPHGRGVDPFSPVLAAALPLRAVRGCAGHVDPAWKIPFANVVPPDEYICHPNDLATHHKVGETRRGKRIIFIGRSHIHPPNHLPCFSRIVIGELGIFAEDIRDSEGNQVFAHWLWAMGNPQGVYHSRNLAFRLCAVCCRKIEGYEHYACLGSGRDGLSVTPRTAPRFVDHLFAIWYVFCDRCVHEHHYRFPHLELVKERTARSP